MDTSALAKLFVEEAGSAAISELMGRGVVVSSAAIAYVELRASIAAALRMGRLRAEERDVVLDRLERLWGNVIDIPLDRPLLRLAGDLAEQAHLRGYDAVHLAALQTTGDREEVTFACWDADLRRAAQALGYALFPPTES